MRFISQLAEWNDRRKNKKAHRLFKELYPDKEDRATSFLREGAELMEIVSFGNGESMQSITVYPEGAGYRIIVDDDSEIESELGW